MIQTIMMNWTEISQHLSVITSEVSAIATLIGVPYKGLILTIGSAAGTSVAITAASIVTRFTKTEVNNRWIFILQKMIELVALNSKPVQLNIDPDKYKEQGK